MGFGGEQRGTQNNESGVGPAAIRENQTEVESTQIQRHQIKMVKHIQHKRDPKTNSSIEIQIRLHPKHIGHHPPSLI
jgi:hypothetical protein